MSQTTNVQTYRPAASDETKRSQGLLHQLLEELEYLDLTGRLSTEDRRVHVALGGYGDVYTAYLWIGGKKVKVALKQLRVFLYKEPRFARLLAKEMQLWSELCHPNILEFLGYILEENGMPSLISEWMENGTALEFVKVHPEIDILPLVLGIAQGLEYLHEQDVVHSDIKSDNVLISEAGVPLICDFGTSRVLAATQTLGGETTSGRLKGSLRWLATELFAEGQSEHTKETDVWAFGMTAYELLAKNRPYYHLRFDSQIMFAIIKGEKPRQPEGHESTSPVWDIWHICSNCWTDQPESRWPVSNVVSFLADKAGVRVPRPTSITGNHSLSTPNASVKEQTVRSKAENISASHGYLSNGGEGTIYPNPSLGLLPESEIDNSLTRADELPPPSKSFVRPGLRPPDISSELHLLYSELIQSGSTPAGLPSSSTSASTTFHPTMGPPSSTKESSQDIADSPDLPQHALFRQLPLLDSDLMQSSIEVVASTIRANDKGKEVPSFVIAVNVIGKESWQMEKFYFEVLDFDSRLRKRCSQSLLQKLEKLPDSKLFKDNAPVRVDRRKIMLQAYLLSVLHLPIKDKNEIIPFFTSNIMHAPSLKNEYKEGYLTKCGKNFGAWKTRYYELQGSRLDYYESRGGSHLGSILITGAQIGRQSEMKTPGPSDEDEYRHALLIIEQKHVSGSENGRHVLCADSDLERDAWIDVLVRYVTGSYNNGEENLEASTFNGLTEARGSESPIS